MISKDKNFKIEKKRLVINMQRRSQLQSLKENCHDAKEIINRQQEKKNSGHSNRNLRGRDRSLTRLSVNQYKFLNLEKKSTSISITKNNPSKEEKKNIFEKQMKRQTDEGGEQYRLIGLNKTVGGFIQALIKQLQTKDQLFQSLASSYHIDKNYFVHIIQYLINILAVHDSINCNRLFHNLNELQDIYQSISRYCQQQKKKQQTHKLSLQSSLFSYSLIALSAKPTLSEYQEIIRDAQMRLQQLTQQLSCKSSLNDQLTLQLSREKIQLAQLVGRINCLKQKQAQIDLLISQKKKKYEELACEIKKIQQYGCKNSQMIRLVSQDYKQIESDLFEYAVYLQSNTLASKPQYEPFPFTEAQKIFLLEYKEMTSTVISKDGSIQKVKQMHEFCQRLISFHHKKDLQINKLLQFKTGCIRKFVQSMKMWLNNWELKQEYLVNLRNQFLIDNDKMHHTLNRIYAAFTESQNNEAREMTSLLTDVYGRIEENYKLGNSFY